jgi:hypothetical protein
MTNCGCIYNLLSISINVPEEVLHSPALLIVIMELAMKVSENNGIE